MRRLLGVILLLFVLALIGAVLGILSLRETIRPAPGPAEVSAFKEIPTGVTHRWDQKTHPFTGAAIIDIDNDGRSEIFVGGGEGQDDWLLAYRNGRLVDIAKDTGVTSKSATHGATAIDLDRDGDTDLALARNDGVFLLLNEAGRFSAKKVPVDLGPDAVPLSVAVGDVNADGHADLYVSAFVSFAAFKSATFNDPEHGKKNRLLVNNGDLTFKDTTGSSGTAGKQNTFTSAFIDLDGDKRQDLVLSQNTGEIEMFRNLGDGRFEAVVTNSGYGFWMGLGAGDFDADGDQDLFFSNLGVSIPAFLTTGDLKPDQRHAAEWLLLRNDGGFKFTDVTADYGLHGHGFSWGAVFEDLNLDGRLDLLVAQNYIKWPLHKLFPLGSKAFLQQDDGSKPGFYHHERLGLDNRHFAQSPLIADINGDAKPDMFWLNMNGPLRAYLNSSKSNVLALAIPDDLASHGTVVTLETKSGTLYRKTLAGSIGLMTDQTPTQFFGLGSETSAKSLTVDMPDGARWQMQDPPLNRTINMRELFRAE